MGSVGTAPGVFSCFEIIRPVCWRGGTEDFDTNST